MSGMQGQSVIPKFYSSRICSSATPDDETWVEDDVNVLFFQTCDEYPELYWFCPCQKHVLIRLKGAKYFKKLSVKVGEVELRPDWRIVMLFTGLVLVV